MKSIRVFLVAVILAVITLFNFVAALRGYQSSMQEAEQLFDKQLLETAQLIANIHAEKITASVDQTSNIAFQVWQGDQLAASSANAPPAAISAFTPGFDYNNFNGYRWRTVAYPDADGGHWILVAERTDLRFTLAENVILKSVLPILLGLPVVGLLIWLIVSQGLKPLRELAGELGNRQGYDLRPLSIATPKRELEQIVASTNDLLQRLETSLQRERQFASDAAHELRTPISTLKVQLYNLSQELPANDPGIEELTLTTKRLEHIVEQILDLYRSSPDRYNAAFVVIDLAALAQEILAEEHARFDRKDQQLEFQGESCQISGDRFALTTLLQNLLSNANKYTPEGGRITVTVQKTPQEILLTVEDSGSGIPEDQHALIFERFYRGGGDRHQSGEQGCGLGLAIVKRIAELHHASIAITPSKFATGTAFHVSFPTDQTEHVSKNSNSHQAVHEH